MKIDERGFRDCWDFVDSIGMLRGYPKSLPKFIVSHGLGSLFAAHMCSQRPGFFVGSISIAPWFSLDFKPNIFSLNMMKAKLLIPTKSYKS